MPWASIVLAQSRSKRSDPATRASAANTAVTGPISPDAPVTPIARMNGWAHQASKSFSGFVSAARKGSTAPRLRDSAREAAPINTARIPMCTRRCRGKWFQTRRRRSESGGNGPGSTCDFFAECPVLVESPFTPAAGADPGLEQPSGPDGPSRCVVRSRPPSYREG